MSALLKTSLEFLRLRGSSSFFDIFDRSYSVYLELDGLRRPAAISPAGLTIEKEICYHPHPGQNRSHQSLDIYAPAAKPSGAGYPVLLFMHGGGWRASDKNDPLGVHANVCKALALRGMVALNVNYRLSPRVKHPGQASDAAAALKWTIENIRAYGGDPERVFVSGHSAGGHLAALVTLDSRYLDEVGLRPNLIKGVIGISGVYNLEHFAGRNWMAEHLMTKVTFGKGQAKRREASPISHVNHDTLPFLLLNAYHDEKLEEEAEELAAALRAKGGSADTAIIRSTNHFTILSRVGNGDDTLIDLMSEFVGSR